MQKLEATGKIIDTDANTVFVSQISDWFLKKSFDILKNVKYKIKLMAYTVILLEVNFHAYNQEFKRENLFSF